MCIKQKLTAKTDDGSIQIGDSVQVLPRFDNSNPNDEVGKVGVVIDKKRNTYYLEGFKSSYPFSRLTKDIDMQVLLPVDVQKLAPGLGQRVKVTNELYIDGGYEGIIDGIQEHALLVRHPLGGDNWERITDCKMIGNPKQQ